jgi:hypothetical protein
VVPLQGPQQVGGALGLGSVLTQSAQQQRQGRAHGCLLGVGTQLLRHLLHGGTLQLGHQLIDQGGEAFMAVTPEEIQHPIVQTVHAASTESHGCHREQSSLPYPVHRPVCPRANGGSLPL